MQFSIITPSMNQSELLRRCVCSVADQAGSFKVEHIVQTMGEEGLAAECHERQESYVLSVYNEKDSGMYDAINKGFLKADGDVYAWLNSDEQYLPGALARVQEAFDAHPEIDLVFGDVVLVDEGNTPLSYRRITVPTLRHTTRCHLATLSAAMFVRKSLVERCGLLDASKRCMADGAWVVEFLKAGAKSLALKEPLSVFVMMGSNLGQSDYAHQELAEWKKEIGTDSTWVAALASLEHKWIKWRNGAYKRREVAVDIYGADHARRESHRAEVGWDWPA